MAIHSCFLSGKLLVVADSHVAFNLWDVDTGTVIKDAEGLEPDKVILYNKPVAFTGSQDGKYVALTHNQGNEPVTLYDTRDWSIVRRVSITDTETKRGNAMSVAAVDRTAKLFTPFELSNNT